MNFVIYVNSQDDLEAGSALTRSLGSDENGELDFKVVNVMEPGDDGVPAAVVQAMLSGSADTFPLTEVNGKMLVYGRMPSSGDVEQIIHDFATAAPGEDFGLTSRIHISLDVNHFERSLAFYKVLLDTEPVKLKKDYAQFILADPPLNLVLNQFGREVNSKDAPTNHFGIQVKSKDGIAQAIERYRKADFHMVEEKDVACCYAVQTKVWVSDPDGNKWEVYIAEAESDHGCGDDCICWQEIASST